MRLPLLTLTEGWRGQESRCCKQVLNFTLKSHTTVEKTRVQRAE